MAETEELQVVKEGTPLNLICEAEGNPEQFRYKWSVDGHAVNGKCTDSHYKAKSFIFILFAGVSSMWTVEENRFLIGSVSREMLNMKIKCEVTNSEGSGENTSNIDVACKKMLNIQQGAEIFKNDQHLLHLT